MDKLFGYLLIFGALFWVADQIDVKAIRRELMLMRMSRKERSAFLEAEREAQLKEQRIKDMDKRVSEYLDAIAGPRKWCLMAMREGRNYTRQEVHLNDLDDVVAWASSNDIAVTEMSRMTERVKLSFGELRRAKKTARFMGEAI